MNCLLLPRNKVTKCYVQNQNDSQKPVENDI